MLIKKHRYGKILKFGAFPLLLLILYFLWPGGGSRFRESRQLSFRSKARRLCLDLERLRVNGRNFWPHAPSTLGGGLALQQEFGHTNAIAYFSWLYRMDDLGAKEWEPRIAGLPISLVTFDDSDREFTANNVMWSVAEDVDDETPDCAIVLVSANFDCSQLFSAYDGNADVPMATSDGKFAVFVRKSGAVDSLEPKYLNARNIYRRQAFSGGPKSYLTPKGRVCTKR